MSQQPYSFNLVYKILVHSLGARFSHLITQFYVIFAKFLRYLHIPALLDIQGVTLKLRIYRAVNDDWDK
jgi:hypothetical protein